MDIHLWISIYGYMDIHMLIPGWLADEGPSIGSRHDGPGIDNCHDGSGIERRQDGPGSIEPLLLPLCVGALPKAPTAAFVRWAPRVT